jgi:hypothetical protein
MATSYIVGLPAAVLHLANLSGGLRDLSNLRATIGTSVPYAGFVLEGTRAHDIVARNAKALFWAGAAHPVARVHHPGTQANPWLRQVFEARRGAIINGIVSGLEQTMRSGEFHAAAGLVDAMDKTLELAKEQAPVRTGTLRESLHTDYFSR